MTEITKIDGSPGAGKSYKLKEFLEQEIQSGLSMGDFAFVTFTNAATDDLVPEVADILGCSDDDARGSVRTLHSMALSEVRRKGIIDDWQTQVISQKSEQGDEENPYQVFADRQGMRYEGTTIKDTKDRGRDGGAADKLYKINEWLSLTRRDPEDSRLAPFKHPWPTHRAVTLLEAWDTFKQSHYNRPRYEHPDYVDVAIDRELTPDIDVLFIDEFQDLSPQEYLYYKVMRDSPEIQRVYLAGDPHQSIYSFRAGTPYYFTETDTDDEIYLSETRRCRGEIADFARSVLNLGPGANTDFNAYHDGGTVKLVDGERDTALSDAVESAVSAGGAFLLARTNSKVYSIKRWLKRQGYPFTALGTRQYSLWGDSSKLDLVKALEALGTGSEHVTIDGIDVLKAHSPTNEVVESELDTTAGRLYTTESVWRAFPYADTVTQLVDELEYKPDTRKAIKNAVFNPERNDPEKLKVGTIHAAKGLERPAVVLFNSYNKYLRDAYHQNDDTRREEHRIGYVGATRAEERLYIVDNFFNGPKMKPIDTALRHAGV